MIISMIIMGMFFNREKEMEKLLELVSSKKAELAIVYGRRRVGKSRLLVEFAKKVNAVYFLADLSKNILDILSKQIKEEFVKFSSWDDFFEWIYKSNHKIIIIDEFQYLYQIDRAWPTILQRWWEKIKETNKKIILVGSLISTIYKIAHGYGSALYGRKTFELCVEPLSFFDISGFFPKYSIEELIKVYSILGGIPRYLEEFDSELSVEENIRKKILEKTAFLYNEPLNLLFEEFRDPSPYIAILLAITQGYEKFNEITTFSRIENNKLPKYLAVLERVKLIEKEIPVTEKKIKTKNTRYKILDNFFRFWFGFVFKNKAYIEQGLIDEVFSEIERGFNSYCGKTFEDVCKEFIIKTRFYNFTKIGRWWYKDNEIDIVALNESTKEILFCECKWSENVNAKEIISELAEKSKYVNWYNEERKEIFAVFAKSFSKKINEFEGKKVFCFDLKDLQKVLKI